MRIGLPRMVLLSVALHLGLLLGFFGLYFHAHRNGGSSSPGQPETLSVIFRLRSQPVSDRLQARRAVSQADSLPENPAAPRPAPPSPKVVPAAPAPALALKDSAQAHVRWPDDSALASSRSPQLDPRDGVVFLLDISGSMYEPYAGTTRLALARQLLAQRIRALREGTPFAIAVYGETALRSGPLVPANAATRAAAIRFVNRDYACGGGTNLPAGLTVAEQLDMGAIVLVTDGDLNTTESELLPQAVQILGAPGQSPSLTVLGIGPRPKTNAEEILQALAHQQDGTCLVGKSAPGGLLTFNKPGAGK